ncbi:surface antigen-like protein [Hymenobacter chitinivorans DSM 11115]|uniref:Surface antigen-like protein n=1 Tax=Hymenobacter chitinivorans DSM 11115 TaxID=1121954 RepID=A0A2M9ARL0_9BACT|nr:surface antigen-like protein [Hymenobacter chitinivorans DSM 11115]
MGLLCASLSAAAQVPAADSLPALTTRPTHDIVDAYRSVFPRTHVTAHDSLALQQGGKFVWLIPTISYTQQTRGLVQLTGNVLFRRPEANLSALTAVLSYTQNKQLIFTATPAVWSKGNRLYWVGDWRLMHYPQSTYGLGMHTTTDRAVTMDYQYLRFYQSVLRRVGPNLYAGLGFSLDDHWDIESRTPRRELTRISSYPYGITGRSISAGPTLSVLYDSRANAINPLGGVYLNTVLRANTQSLGSNRSYQTLLVDARRYLRLSPRTTDVLAFWSYNALTLHGNPPFLDLPSTGWDTFSNLGRGFIQGRFRGKNLLYAEAEYRFGITRNHLLGGVVFGNAQTVSEDLHLESGSLASQFDRVMPAVGAGMRLNLNKVSRTNLSVDYGIGADGSKGLVVNLGEVF